MVKTITEFAWSLPRNYAREQLSVDWSSETPGVFVIDDSSNAVYLEANDLDDLIRALTQLKETMTHAEH